MFTFQRAMKLGAAISIPKDGETESTVSFPLLGVEEWQLSSSYISSQSHNFRVPLLSQKSLSYVHGDIWLSSCYPERGKWGAGDQCHCYCK